MSFTAEIEADISDFIRNLDKAQARIDEFANTVGKRLEEIGDAFQNVGAKLTVGLTAPIIAAGAAAYKMAADFEDALGATDQIFKNASGATQEWANNLPTYFGIAKKEALEYSNMMGSMLVNIGNLTEKEASEQSAKLIELAGDLTAMYGGTTQDAVRALTGALKGNNTMLDNYGMAANDALVKAKALEMGLVKQGKEMSLNAKQAATLALIYEQSAAAQGQAAREAEGSSGAMRALRTEITNLATEFGNNLLPIITPIINRLREMIAGFRAMSPEMKRAVTVVAALAAAIGPLLVGIGALLKLVPLVGTAFSVVTGPIGLAVAAVAAAAVAIYKNWDKISKYFTSGEGGRFWSSISASASKLYNQLSRLMTELMNLFDLIWNKIGKNVIAIVSSSFGNILAVIELVVNNISGMLSVLAALVRGDFAEAFRRWKDVAAKAFDSFLKIATNTLKIAANYMSAFLKLIGDNKLALTLDIWSGSIGEVKSAFDDIIDVDMPDKFKKIEESVKPIAPQLDDVAKATKNFRLELETTLASFGLYSAQLYVLNHNHKELDILAKKAGASLAQLQIIGNQKWADRFKLETQKAIGVVNELVAAIPRTSVADLTLTIDIGAASEKLRKDTEKLKAPILNFAKSLKESLNTIINDGIINTIASVSESLGASLISGDSIIKSAGAALLGSFGSIMVDLGKMSLQAGIAIEAVKKALTSLQGPLAIAAGVALIAVGSAFKSGAGKIGNSMGTTGGYSASTMSGVTQNQDMTRWRGALYNNEKQTVELKLSNGDLKGAINLGDQRNTRLS